MVKATSVTTSGPYRLDRRDHRDRRATGPPTDQPLPERRARHRHRVMWEGSDPIPANQDDARRCTHWPEGGANRIQLAAHALHVLAESMSQQGASLRPAAPHFGCVDLQLLPAEPVDPSVPQHTAAWADQVLVQKLALRLLASDFATVSAWLAKAADLNRDAAKPLRQHAGLLVALGESQRLVSKDSLSADVNALIAAMLQRAAALLDRPEFAAGSAKTEPAAQRSFQPVLRQAAALLDTAATLADSAENLVADFDRRWRQVRHQVALAIARAGIPGTSADNNG